MWNIQDFPKCLKKCFQFTISSAIPDILNLLYMTEFRDRANLAFNFHKN